MYYAQGGGDPPIHNPGGANPSSSQTWTMVVSWGLAPGCPNPDYFEIVAYTGSDPTNVSNWIFPPVATADGTVRTLSIGYSLSASPSGPVSAAVRSVYGGLATITPSTPIRMRPIGHGV